jgi:hypothetical protein
MRDAVVADFRSSAWSSRLALIGVCAWLAYEWGPGNETVTSWALASLVERYDGAGAVLAAAVFAFGFTTVQQAASGLTALLGFSLLERTSEASWARLRTAESRLVGGWSSMGLGTRSAIVFGLGTTAVALMQIMTTGTTGVRAHARAVLSSAVLCGLLVMAIGTTAALLVEIGRSIDALAGPTERLVSLLASPWPWLGLAAVLVLLQIRSARAGRA